MKQGPSSGARLLLLTRENCGLCEEFVEEFLSAVPELAGELAFADVDSRAGWAGRHGHVIPVLLDEEGTVICESRFDAAKIDAWRAASHS